MKNKSYQKEKRSSEQEARDQFAVVLESVRKEIKIIGEGQLGINAKLAEMDNKIDRLDNKIEEVRIELKAETQEVRQEVKDLRGEMNDNFTRTFKMIELVEDETKKELINLKFRVAKLEQQGI